MKLSVRAIVPALAFALLTAALFVAFPATTNAAPRHDAVTQPIHADAQFCTTIVQRGDALYKIAARFHTTTAYLAALNNLFNPNYIYSGMVLKVPCGPVPQPYPQPQPQPHPNPNPGGWTVCNYYIVQRGDWLKTIAARFGVSWQLLAQANGLHNANYIYAGQRLVIPCAHPVPPVCPGCPPCQGCPPVQPTVIPPPICPGCPPVCPGCPCQGCPPIYPTPVPVYSNIEIHDNFFAPPVITIHQHQFVQWVNKGGKPHSVTQGLCPNNICTPTPGGFNSGPLNPGQSFAFQFNQLGTFAYFDMFTGVGASVAVVP